MRRGSASKPIRAAVAARRGSRVGSRRSSKRQPSWRSEFPPSESSGYLVRDAHRAFQRLLERRIAAYGVTRGQWYFLRVLWNEDGRSFGQIRPAGSRSSWGTRGSGTMEPYLAGFR